MNRKTIEKVGLPLLLLVFIVMIGNLLTQMGVLGRRKASPSAAKPNIASPLSSRLVSDNAPETAKKTLPAGEMGWGRDPFVPYEMAFQEADSIQNLRLMGITASSDKKAYSAIINDEVMTIGSRIGKFEIISIKKDRVIVKDDKGRYDLKLTE